MEIAKSKNARWESNRLSWVQTAARLAPLWMMAVAVSAEGFPSPPISANLGFILFWAAIPVAILMVVKGWAWVEIPLISLVPIYFFIIFDEITTTYKTPFIFFCTLILSIGVIAYEPFTEKRWRWLVLLAAVALALVAANHVAGNFWAYTSSLGIGECFIDYTGCPPLPADSPTWWSFFFS